MENTRQQPVFASQTEDGQIADLLNQLETKEKELKDLQWKYGHRHKEAVQLNTTVKQNDRQALIQKKLHNREVYKLSQEIFVLKIALQKRAEALEEQDVEIQNLQDQLGKTKAGAEALKAKTKLGRVLDWALGTPSKQSFPFLKLPAEIRNRIYRYSLTSRRPLEMWPMIPLDAAPFTTRDAILDDNVKNINTALLRVSRQVHTEATYVLYRYNRFRFSDMGGWTILQSFLSRIGNNCNFLTNISITWPDWNAHDFATFGNDDKVKKLNQDLAYTVQKRYKLTVGAPNGPSHESDQAQRICCGIISKLPALKRFNIVVPHTYRVQEMGRPVRIEGIFFCHFTQCISKPTRSFILLRRDPSMPQVIGQHWTQDTDDELGMGRTVLRKMAAEAGREVMTASYGKVADGMSYVVDGGEAANDIDRELPSWVNVGQPGPSGFMMWLRNAFV